jgi:heme-degrading monooxygenase HmoA
MFSHVVVFRFKPCTTDQQVDAIEQGMAGLPARLPGMRSYAFGRDLGIVEGNGDFAVVAEFDDEAAWLVYQKDDEHRRVIEQLIVPVTAERHAVQLRHP